jgi:hypothetical protein
MQYNRAFPSNLANLHSAEESLRSKSLEIVLDNERLQLHLGAVEAAMELADMLRQFETKDENLKVIQVLGMRVFNAFGASVKLALSGYCQNSTLIMRDIMETAFLIDYFSSDRKLIERRRLADRKTRIREFRPDTNPH